MPKSVITVTNISKKYNITHQRGGYIALRDVIMNVLKSPFKFLKTKANQIIGRSTKEDFWALKDVNFTLHKGEVLGIIGKNGSGKSTLLKIMSQITPPTTGEIKIYGRVGSLLEVGTGFHPELTGRENIFLNGAILGMTKREVVERFDKIVEFSGIEKFLDTPVKYYSSGMYVRLAFSVAAHMESDILIVDEVLAVGDAEFQKKCMGKMKDLATDGGRTIILVSHNMAAIEQMCSQVVLLEKGAVAKVGPTKDVINAYLDKFLEFGEGEVALLEKHDADMTFTKVSIVNSEDAVTNELKQNENFHVNLELKVLKETSGVDVSVSFRNSQNTDILFSSLSDKMKGQLKTFKPGIYNFKINFTGGYLMPGPYSLRISAHHPGILNIDTREDVLGFSIANISIGKRSLNYGVGTVNFPSEWHE